MLSTQMSILSCEFLEALVLFILFIPPFLVKVKSAASNPGGFSLLNLQVDAKNRGP